MGDLDSVAKVRAAFYRLTGTDANDPALTEQGETESQVVDYYLTRGSRKAQRWMIRMGYDGWITRSSALSFSGADATDGGRFVDLPSDFLRAFGHQREGARAHGSALEEADGTPWGHQVDAEDARRRGDNYYIRGTQLWITRNAEPPTTLYLKYHHLHPAWSDSVTIDFPLEARPLIVAEAANDAKEESWLPGGQEMEQKIERALMRARDEARNIARPTKQPRSFRRPVRYGNAW